MNTFDPYSKKVICEFLNEQVAPRGYGGYGRKYTQPKTQKEAEKRAEMIRYGRTGVPSGWDPNNQAMWWNYRGMVEKGLEGFTAGTIAGLIQSGPIDTARSVVGAAIDAGASRRTSNPRAAAKLADIGKAGVEKGFNMLDKSAELAAIPIEYAVKQAIRTGLAKVYLGGEEDPLEAVRKEMEKNLAPPEPGEGGGMISPEQYEKSERKGNIPKWIMDKVGTVVYSLIDPSAYSDQGFKNLFGKGRLGETGQRQAADISRIAVLGKDPLEYALTRMGAKDASEAIARTATTNVGAVSTLGGSLENLRRMGIAK